MKKQLSTSGLMAAVGLVTVMRAAPPTLVLSNHIIIDSRGGCLMDSHVGRHAVTGGARCRVI
jgi:hypothetical protein